MFIVDNQIRTLTSVCYCNIFEKICYNFGEMQNLTRTIYTMLLVMVLTITILGCGCRRNRNRVTHREVVSDTLKNFIRYQEEADKDMVVSLVVEDQREIFKRNLEEATRDDMIHSAIEFEEYNYQLQEIDDKVAVFWSEPGKSYLILTIENGKWLINPGATDEINN